MKARSGSTKRLVGMAFLTALIVVLQLIGSFIKIGPVSFSLVLIPMVVGAALYGPGAGAYFGGVFGVVVMIGCITGADWGGNVLWNASPVITALLCLVKGIAAGYVAGVVYRAVAKKNKVLGCILAAIVCPLVNTGIFCAAMYVFYKDILVSWAGGADLMYYVIFSMVGINFLVEMLVNVIVSPIIVRIVDIRKKI